nr:transposase [uncultured Anaerosporobacter sp.]
MTHQYTFIVTNMELKAEDVIQFDCNQGRMENFIKECKLGFNMDSMNSHSMTVNVNRLQISMLAYNLFNWFRRLVLPSKMRKLQIDTNRLKLFKIVAKLVHSARYLKFKLCSSCPYP